MYTEPTNCPLVRGGHFSTATLSWIGGFWAAGRRMAFSWGDPGLPFTVTISGTATNTGAVSSRANVIPGVAQYPANKTISQWFNPAAFTSPTAYNWGNVGQKHAPRTERGQCRLLAGEAFPDHGRSCLLFRVEFFNMFNHPQFQVPAAVINSGGAGTITSTSNTARQIQAALTIDLLKK